MLILKDEVIELMMNQEQFIVKENSLIEAYETTISDFQIELDCTEWWRFKRINWLNKQITGYEERLEKEYDKQRSGVSE